MPNATNHIQDINPVRLDDEKDALEILDQTLLPGEIKYTRLSSIEDIWEAIYNLRVRGAPAIGIAGGYGIYLAAKQSRSKHFVSFYEEFSKAKAYLGSSRPTAVNLFWALNRMEQCVLENKDRSIAQIKNALLEECNKIHVEDENTCKLIGENGLALLKPGMGILTHCNAGALATSKYGTALSPIYLGNQKDYNFKVFVGETRPLLQGSRLTAWELMNSGIDVTLICDSMAACVMKKGLIDAVLVGCDRVAANGDAANKIGTLGLAVLAKEYGIPFYIHAPFSTIDLKTGKGMDIKIEERPGEEIFRGLYINDMAPKGVKTYNPAFDVTDAAFITGIVTERGVIYPPYEDNLKELSKLTEV